MNSKTNILCMIFYMAFSNRPVVIMFAAISAAVPQGAHSPTTATRPVQPGDRCWRGRGRLDTPV